MKDLVADFLRQANDEYQVFLYSDTDEIEPVSVKITAQNSFELDGSVLSYDILQPYQSGRVLQNAKGVFVVDENVLKSGVI